LGKCKTHTFEFALFSNTLYYTFELTRNDEKKVEIREPKKKLDFFFSLLSRTLFLYTFT